MKKDYDKKYILTSRCNETDYIYDGSEKRPCVRCGEDCWVSPALKNEKVDGVICSHCLTEKEKEKCDFFIKPEVLRQSMERIAHQRYAM